MHAELCDDDLSVGRHRVVLLMRDNVFIERLWRSVKYEDVYLKAYTSVPQARDSLARYFTFYNTRRPHQALDGRTPDQAHFTSLQLPAAA